MSSEYSHYNRNNKERARKLRTHGTRGEAYLWTKLLSRKQFHGYTFNRQFPIDRYIADFISRKLKLIVELDGKYHENQVEYDRRRDKRLNELGFKVVRIPEADMYRDFDNVVRALEAFLPEKDLE